MNPYSVLPDSAFWRQAVANRNMFDIAGLWDPKLDLRRGHKVATFGSCFAQHIGGALAAHGYAWLNTEPAPYGLSGAGARRYGYDVFSCRTGNIYTASLLRQWVGWALEKASPPPEEHWEKAGRVHDPFRPTLEPEGFGSIAEMTDSRAVAIDAFRRALDEADVLVFTLGLTESWLSRVHGQEYPLCPGTAAGEFDPERHEFRNQRFDEIRSSLREALAWMRDANPRLHVILTVSPVPLTATNSQRHVLVATMESKSILRAVAGELAAAPWIDYFPSYEIICAPPFRGVFYEPNLRSVNKRGVGFVMDSFFHCLGTKYGTEPLTDPAPGQQEATEDRVDPVCDEEMLAAFGDRS